MAEAAPKLLEKPTHRWALWHGKFVPPPPDVRLSDPRWSSSSSQRTILRFVSATPDGRRTSTQTATSTQTVGRDGRHSDPMGIWSGIHGRYAEYYVLADCGLYDVGLFVVLLWFGFSGSFPTNLRSKVVINKFLQCELQRPEKKR
ncbi:hypothetical protein PENNAL_c0005G01804 [Penicillium nalgiovense]|uniref:Uncharacterized protein n=1 Tax=Penicillium nalgiovense TaxID=60175 RepID=A0A1V6Z1G6_PENNA|nr:hypothetical protein PENNAL_c0005G01804 [Penicillium nalgiovense]